MRGGCGKSSKLKGLGAEEAAEGANQGEEESEDGEENASFGQISI